MSSAGAHNPYAVRLFEALVDAHTEIGRKAHLELRRRLIQDVRKHEAAGSGQCRSRRRGERAPGHAQPDAPGDKRRAVVRIARAYLRRSRGGGGRLAGKIGRRRGRRFGCNWCNRFGCDRCGRNGCAGCNRCTRCNGCVRCAWCRGFRFVSHGLFSEMSSTLRLPPA